MVLAISIFFNIAVGIHKCTKLTASRRYSTTGGNQIRNNPEVSLPSGNRNEEDALEMTLVSSGLPLLAEPESSLHQNSEEIDTFKRYRSKRNEGARQCNLNIPYGSMFNEKRSSADQQTCGLRVSTKGADEILSSKDAPAQEQEKL